MAKVNTTKLYAGTNTTYTFSSSCNAAIVIIGMGRSASPSLSISGGGTISKIDQIYTSPGYATDYQAIYYVLNAVSGTKLTSTSQSLCVYNLNCPKKVKSISTTALNRLINYPGESGDYNFSTTISSTYDVVFGMSIQAELDDIQSGREDVYNFGTADQIKFGNYVLYENTGGFFNSSFINSPPKGVTLTIAMDNWGWKGSEYQIHSGLYVGVTVKLASSKKRHLIALPK